MIRRLRKHFSKQWCPKQDYLRKHVLKRYPFQSHFCSWDYCNCNFFYCVSCKKVIHYKDGVDECR